MGEIDSYDISAGYEMACVTEMLYVGTTNIRRVLWQKQ